MSVWTPADAAELELLIHRLANDYHEHRYWCDTCAGKQPCRAVQKAINIVLEWRHLRELQSTAEELRRMQLERDFALETAAA